MRHVDKVTTKTNDTTVDRIKVTNQWERGTNINEINVGVEVTKLV